MTHPWWEWYAVSLGAYIVFPVVMGRRWYQKVLGAVFMTILWCLIIFTQEGQLMVCWYDPYRPATESCYVQLPQQHIDPPKHWWKNPPLP